MTRVAEQTGRNLNKLLALPEIGPEVLYLWRHYCEVKGQDPITFQELEAWQNVTGNKLSPGEIGVLRKLDAAFITREK